MFQHSDKMKLALSGGRAIVVTREFQAPRELVWKAMTEPELIKKWLTGPPGVIMSVCEVDLRVGGKYRYVWRNPDGSEMGMGGVHREVVAPAKIVATQMFDQDWTGGEAVGTLEFTERNGVTTMTNTVVYATPEARAGVLQTPMEHGMAMGYDRLEEVLSAK